jgi:hypothetical protein
LSGKVLAKMFRGKFLCCSAARIADTNSGLRPAHGLPEAGYLRSTLPTAQATGLVVDSKAPFGSPEHALKYLARFTHRVAIPNGRLIEMQDGQVTFRWRDSANGN